MPVRMVLKVAGALLAFVVVYYCFSFFGEMSFHSENLKLLHDINSVVQGVHGLVKTVNVSIKNIESKFERGKNGILESTQICPICGDNGWESMKVATLEDMQKLASCGDCRKIKYSFPSCNQIFNVPTLVPVAAAHAIEWNIMGKERPWWSVLTSEEYANLTEIPHELALKFYKSAQAINTDVSKTIKMLPTDMQPEKALDFGCGLGRLSNKLADSYEHVFCADQSIHHLRLGKQTLDELFPEKSPRIFPLLTNLNLVGNLYSTYNTLVDGVYTFIVLQHSISILQALFIEQLCDVLIPGGVGVLQIPANPKYTSCDFEKSIRQGGLQMYSTPKEEIERHLMYRGCQIIEIYFCDRTGGDYDSTCVIWKKQLSNF